MKKSGTIDWALFAKKINGKILATPSARAIQAFGLITKELLYVVVKNYTVRNAVV